MKKTEFIAFACVVVTLALGCCNAFAKTVFLPDWQEIKLGAGSGNDFSKDDNWCETAQDEFGGLLYHFGPTCIAPEVYADWCPHNNEYITDCYCPMEYSKTCRGSEEKGDIRVKKEHEVRDKDTGNWVATGQYFHECGGLYLACCSTACVNGGSKTGPGSNQCANTVADGCGEHTCYTNIRDDTCRSGYNDSTTGDCGDSYTNDCGRTCYRYESCPTSPSDGGDSGSSGSGGNGSSGSGNDGNCCKYKVMVHCDNGKVWESVHNFNTCDNDYQPYRHGRQHWSQCGGYGDIIDEGC